MLIDKCTDAFAAFYERQKRTLGDRFVGTHLGGFDWQPPSAPVGASLDSLVMVSEAHLRDFYLPHLQKLAGRVGPLHVHSCGNFAKIVRPLTDAPSVAAVNSSQMSVRQLAEAGSGKDKILTVYGGCGEAADAAAAARRYGIKFRFSVTDLFEWGKKIEDYTPADKIRVKEKQKRLEDILAL